MRSLSQPQFHIERLLHAGLIGRPPRTDCSHQAIHTPTEISGHRIRSQHNQCDETCKYQPETKAIHPTMSAFNDPSTCLEAGFLTDSLGFLAARANVCGETELANDVSDFVEVIAFIQAQTLWFGPCWPRTLRHDARECFLDQFHVMPVGTVNDDGQRNAGRFGQKTALDALLSPVRRVRTRFLSWTAALSSWHRPSTTTTTRSLSSHRIGSDPCATALRKPQPLCIPESVGMPNYRNRSPSHRVHSIDTRFLINPFPKRPVSASIQWKRRHEYILEAVNCHF